ncbi:MAG: hypothetical protein Q8O98_00225 [bacterium]|nr:hypothetical protein [bacterium]
MKWRETVVRKRAGARLIADGFKLVYAEFARNSHMPRSLKELSLALNIQEDEVRAVLNRFRSTFEPLPNKPDVYQTLGRDIVKVSPTGVLYANPKELWQQPDVIREVEQMQDFVKSKGGVPFTIRD